MPFPAGLQHPAVDIAVVRGGKNQNRTFDIRRFKHPRDMPDFSARNQCGGLFTKFRTDNGNLRAGIQQMTDLTERHFAAADRQTRTIRQKQGDRKRILMEGGIAHCLTVYTDLHPSEYIKCEPQFPKSILNNQKAVFTQTEVFQPAEKPEKTVLC